MLITRCYKTIVYTNTVNPLSPSLASTATLVTKSSPHANRIRSAVAGDTRCTGSVLVAGGAWSRLAAVMASRMAKKTVEKFEKFNANSAGIYDSEHASI